MAMTAFKQIPVQAVQTYWNRRPCNIRHSPKRVGSRQYFDEVRDRKYFVEPHIPRFAGFEKWHGRRVLEIGCGIGTDTISFASAGAQVTAVDLSETSLALARQRAQVYGLADRVRFYHSNAESLADVVPQEPYDLVYSFGVIHHTPHPDRVLGQLRRYMQPGGTLKVMVYHRYAWKVLRILLTYGRGRVWDLDRLIAQHSEAQTGCPITYSYSRATARRLLESHGFQVTESFVDHIFPYRVQDYKQYRYVKHWVFRVMPPALFRYLEQRLGWHLCLTAQA